MFGFFRRWMNHFSANMQGAAVPEVDPESLPLFDRCRYVYQNLNVAAFADYKQRHGHGKMVMVVHNNIDACIQDIAAHISSLERSGEILPAKVEYTAGARPINRFFITNEGFYLPSVRDRIQALADVMLDLHVTLNAAKHPEYDTKSYNLRMLNSLLHVMLELGLTLTDISQEIIVSR